jgi:hypothetical protein
LGTGQGTSIGERYVISPYIGGGYLHITGNNGSVTINPEAIDVNNVPTDIFKITNKNNNTVVQISTDGSASFTGTITATGGQLGGFNINTKDMTFTDTNGKVKCFFSGSNLQEGKYSVGTSGARNDWFVWNRASDATDTSVGQFGVTKDGILYATNAVFSGAISGSTISGSSITGGSISIGGAAGSPNFYVDELGNVKLNGNITWGTGASPT